MIVLNINCLQMCESVKVFCLRGLIFSDAMNSLLITRKKALLYSIFFKKLNINIKDININIRNININMRNLTIHFGLLCFAEEKLVALEREVYTNWTDLLGAINCNRHFLFL